MSKVNRNQPKRSSASEARYSIFEFDKEFPDDGSCLDFLVAKFYPGGIYCPHCKKVTKHHRDKKRPSYACQYCGHHEHPLRGTIFEGSATSLRLWFYGIYLMASTRCGISAKQLERELGVTYKTAWRMFNKMRSLLSQDDDMEFAGIVEADEVFIGGKAKWRSRGLPEGNQKAYERKTPVLGLAQRIPGAPGQIKASVLKGTGVGHLLPAVTKRVLPGSMVYTDEWPTYKGLKKQGYKHARVRHSENVYVSGDVHTNTIEGFFSLLQRGISGVYHGVSTRWLQSYLDEYTFRYNNRMATGRGMFDAFLSRIEKASPETS